MKLHLIMKRAVASNIAPAPIPQRLTREKAQGHSPFQLLPVLLQVKRGMMMMMMMDPQSLLQLFMHL
jgi:hypothetical protein